MGKKYMGRVGQLIRRKLTQLLLEESNDPRLANVTITDVVVNRDTSRAEVFYSIIGSADEIAEIQNVLDGAAGWLRSEMAPSLRLRNVPKLVFTYDPSLAQGARIEALLQQERHRQDLETPDFAEDLEEDSEDDDDGADA
ncbi:MAG TPA: 30S ribosome-binding factor RbfA [Anaerolineae bacterium]|nr:30S ribosome-binding factor RbfA [Anaerolineae bacterium]HQK15735.1 30S ribosome-binding factor RbfA [Anaerolineae bacterium]